MKEKMKEYIQQYNKGGFTYKELEWELLNLFSVSHRTLLEQKQAKYNEICAWFDLEYDSNTDEDKFREMQKAADETNAQIKLLRHIISEYGG